MEMFSKILRIENQFGEIIDIRTPSILRSEELRERIIELLKMSSEEGLKELTFSDAYKQVKKFRKLVKVIMQSVGVEADDICADYLTQLLLPHPGFDDEGKEILVTQGELLTFMFGVPPEEQIKHSKEDIDGLAKLMGEVWAITEDFGETVNLLDTLSYQDLGKVLEHRTEALLPPEEKSKRMQQKASKELMKNISEGKVISKEGNDKGKELSPEEIDKFI